MKTTPATCVPTSVLERILDHYNPQLAYHNANHALHVHRTAVGLLAADPEPAPHPRRLVVELAALLHDAGYDQAPAGTSRERHSADLAADLLGTLGYPTRVCGDVADAILATELHPNRITPAGAVVRAADLLELAAPWPVFAANTRLLRHEAAHLNGADAGDGAWRHQAGHVVGTLVEGPMWLPATAADEDPVTAWRTRARTNLGRLRAG